ncbi:MAG TPA: prolipoprotein diacylglyceryl transferase [Verrucomicrobiae bacterium]|nr:prolipoprotein diacylglyceryl transferase [Verrucomicrobiae bacterium]
MAYIFWNVQPEAFHLGPLTVRWYGLFFAALFAIGYLIARWQFRIEHKNETDLDTLLVYIVAGTIVGARLGHCLFYDPAYYLQNPLEILEVWKGGLASHGGALGVLIAIYLYCRRRPDQPYLWLLDRVVVPTALGGCFIRLGNLFNSEILGTPTHVPWAFIFHREDDMPRHPAQLYEAVAYALVFILLLLLYRRYRAATPRGLLLGTFLVSVFSFRFLIEFVKQRQAAYEQNFLISVGQWLSIPFIIAGVVLLWRALKTKKAA